MRVGRDLRCHLRSGLCPSCSQRSHQCWSGRCSSCSVPRSSVVSCACLMWKIGTPTMQTPSSASALAPRRCRLLVRFLLVADILADFTHFSSAADRPFLGFPRSNHVRVLGVARCSWLHRALLACPSLHSPAQSQCQVLLGVWSCVRSDEPCFANAHVEDYTCLLPFYERGVGDTLLLVGCATCLLYVSTAFRALWYPSSRRTSRADGVQLVRDVVRGHLTSVADGDCW